MLEALGGPLPDDGAAWYCSARWLEGEYTYSSAWLRGEREEDERDPARCNAPAKVFMFKSVALPDRWMRALCEDHATEVGAINARVCRDCGNPQKYDSDTGEPHGRHGRCFVCDWSFTHKSDLEDEPDDEDQEFLEELWEFNDEGKS